jgi:hypothetical protein
MRRLCRGILNAASNGGDESGRLRLFTLRSGPDICLAIDADVPNLDPAKLQGTLQELRSSVAAGAPKFADVQLRSLRGSRDRSLACCEIRLARAPPDGTPPEDDARGRWTSAFEGLAHALRAHPPAGLDMQTLGRLDGALIRTVQAWPAQQTTLGERLDQARESAPHLGARCGAAKEHLHRLGAALHVQAVRVEHLAHCGNLERPTDHAAAERVAHALEEWVEAVRRFDEEVDALCLDALWMDLGTID